MRVNDKQVDVEIDDDNTSMTLTDSTHSCLKRIATTKIQNYFA